MAAAGLPEAIDDEEGYAPLAEINVTPLVDVILVLLIVFMVAAPLMTVGVPVDLPRTSAATVTQPREPIVLSIDETGALFLGRDPLPAEGAEAHLRALATEAGDTVVYVRGDRAIPYGRVMEVMGLLGRAGFGRVSLIAQGEPAAAP
jgi:biopolymer transport protein ExbD